MAISSHGGTREKYRYLQELDDSEHITNHDNVLLLEKVTSRRKLCEQALCVLAGVVVLLEFSIILHVLFLRIELNEELSTVHTSGRRMHHLSVPFKNNIKKSNSYFEGFVRTQNEKVISCYYNAPDENSKNQLMPSDINPHLCTHINVAFACIINKIISIDDSLNRTLLEIVKLKEQNSKLKVLLSVGGAGNNNGFSDMVLNHASRKVFIKSVKSVLRKYNLDGIDLDWEFPALHIPRDKHGGRERQHFSQLLHEIRMEYIREKREYMLTVATASPETIVNVSYDVDQINMYVDYVNIMTYDYHYYTKYTPFTGFNSPLYPRPEESLYLATLNINYTITMYMNKGLDLNKIVVGIPTYGHTFTLVNINNGNVGSPASGFGSLGAAGFVDYSDVCDYLKEFYKTVEMKYDAAARVPYLHRAREWVSYEDPQSVMEKAAHIRKRDLRGAMIYSLNADDYGGVCGHSTHGHSRFPLAYAVRNALLPPPSSLTTR